jgi:DNA-binding transcriptional LysR family regulator
MDITQVRYFVSVAETLNFRESARRLGVSQSSVSRQIVDLEARLGVALFARSSRSVALTEEGKSFLPYAGLCSAARQRQVFNDQMSSGRASLVATVSTSAPVLIKCLEAFQAYPTSPWSQPEYRARADPCHARGKARLPLRPRGHASGRRTAGLSSDPYGRFGDRRAQGARPDAAPAAAQLCRA